jgi:hypothetical protein
MGMTIEEAMTHEFGQGMAAGIALTLKLLLGEADAAGTLAYPGAEDLPEDVERWARDALARLQEAT